jgi:hypothetical protein
MAEEQSGGYNIHFGAKFIVESTGETCFAVGMVVRGLLVRDRVRRNLKAAVGACFDTTGGYPETPNDRFDR